MGISSRTLILAVVITAVATVVIAALLVNIFERRQEARTTFFRVVEITDDTEDPALWGKNFPLQYDSYRSTVDMQRTRYGGSEAFPQAPRDPDPRQVVTQSKIDEDPRLKRLWAGYPFSVDFREERGHAYMLLDQTYTRRVQEFKQPGACLNCHASTYVYMKQLGNGDIFAGFTKMNAIPYGEARKHVAHPVSCIDCHDPQTMRLRITRPAFIEGIRAYKHSVGITDYDPNRDASAQDMRSYVCGQCHVEYYFLGAERRLTYPWSKGLRADDIYQYYRENPHTDWTHAETGAPALKAQHPEFEMFNQGVHARSGVACADCHMPYRREGGMKISDHHVRSPMLNINRACQGCHHFPEEEMRARVENIQTRFFESRNIAMDAVVQLIDDIQRAKNDPATAAGANIERAREFQREAQFYLDFAEAENSTGFHAPQETMRVLMLAVDRARRGQLTIRGVPANEIVDTPLPVQVDPNRSRTGAPERTGGRESKGTRRNPSD
jgi:nitrite reductase (cytochrome c-552)